MQQHTIIQRRDIKVKIWLINPLLAGCAMVTLLIGINGLTSESSANSDEHYRTCMSAARHQPERGLKQAETWIGTGGGEAAEYCAAASLFALGRFAQAAERFAGLADRAPLNARRIILLSQASRAWYQAEDPIQAINYINQALKLKPDDPELLIDRAEINASRGLYSQAVDDLTAAIGINPKLADAYAFRASAYRQLGNPHAALADLDQALEIVPMHAESLLERGLIRRTLGDIDGARRDWQALVMHSSNLDVVGSAKYYLERFPTTYSQD